MIKRVIVLFLLITSLTLWAQRPLLFDKPVVENPQVRFIRLNTDQGLSNNRVTDLLQDQFGYVWIATSDGLNRYDGRMFEVYKHNPDNFTSVSSSHISSLATNGSSELYVGTKMGVNLYNRLTNSFENIQFIGDSVIPAQPYVREMIFQNDSVLWLDLQEGFLIKYNIRQQTILAKYRHDPSQQPYYLYHKLYFDHDGRLWIGGRGMNIMYLDQEKNCLVAISASEHDYSKKRAQDIACYYEDSRQNFWVTGLDGAYLMDRKTLKFQKFIAYTTYDIQEDQVGNLWFATGSGIFRFSPSDSSMMVFSNKKDNPHSVSNNSVFKILLDRAGNLWFGTALGINIYNPSAYPFNTYTHIPGISNSPEGYMVTAVAEDSNNDLWIGYDEDGMDLFQLRTDRFKHFNQYEGGRNHLADNHVSALYFDQDQLLWIGLWRGIGFNLYQPDKQQFSLFTYHPKSLEKDWYSDFCEDANGRFYIGFWGADGLMLFDRTTFEFGESLKDRFQRVNCSRIISRLFRDSKNSIWVGTTDCGLHRYFPESDTSKAFFSDAEQYTGLTSNNISDICEDNSGQIWVLSNTLQKYNPVDGQFSSYGFKEGFYTNQPTAILPDNQDNLWISTRGDGLFKFNIQSEVFTQYLKQDGLQNNTFSKARLKLENGNLFFGGVNGFNLFQPEQIVADTMVPTPFFGRLFIYDHIYSHDLNQQKYLTLEPDEKVFTIELNSTDLVNPERYLYQCKLDGFDEGWVDIDNRQRKVRFAAIPSGYYTLRYRIGDRNGNWSAHTASIEVAVLKPFYYKLWFFVLTLLLLAVLLFLYVKRREYELKLYGRTVELQQRIFRLQMNPHFMGNSLLAIQNFIYTHDPKSAGNYLSDFAKLFRLILNNSKSEFITLSKELETLELYLKLQSLRFPKKFDYAFEVDEKIDPDDMMIPPMLAQPMIENALEHGLFAKKGNGHLVVRFIYQPNYLVFEVDDDGIGLTAALELSMRKKDHESTALQITRERISILSKKHGYQVAFSVKEKKDDNGKSLGTIVRFTIPYKYFTDV